MNTPHSSLPSEHSRKHDAAPEAPLSGDAQAATIPASDTGQPKQAEEEPQAVKKEASDKPETPAQAATAPANETGQQAAKEGSPQTGQGEASGKQDPKAQAATVQANETGQPAQKEEKQQTGQGEASDKQKAEAEGKEEKKLPTLHRDVATLDPPLQDKVREMLADGATFEDVVDTINELGSVRVTLQAIRNFFRRNFEVQRARVARQIENAEALLASIGHPESAEGQLARAAFLDGFLRLDRATASVTPRDADLARARRAHQKLDQQYLVMRNRKAEVELELGRLRKRNEEAKLKFVRLRMQNMRQDMVAACKTRRLSGDAVRQIREIYGLLDEPLGVMPLEPSQMPRSPQEMELVRAEEAGKRLSASPDVGDLVEAFRDDDEQD